MSFSDILDTKIEARRGGPSPVMVAAWAKDPSRHPDVVRLREDVAAMVSRMAEHPVFRRLVGEEPRIELKKSDFTDGTACIAVTGLAADFRFQVEPDRLGRTANALTLNLTIMVAQPFSKVLGCGYFYGSELPVRGMLDDSAAFLVACEDMIAEFLADAAGTEPGRELLEGLDIQVPSHHPAPVPDVEASGKQLGGTERADPPTLQAADRPVSWWRRLFRS